MSDKLDILAETTSDNSLNLLSDEDSDDFEKMLNSFISQEFENSIQEAQMEIEEQKEVEEQQNKEENIDNININTNTIQLGEHEYSLFRAYKNFMYAMNILTEEYNMTSIFSHLNEKKLYPHYKKTAGNAVSKDVLKGWDIMMQLFPDDMHTIKPNSSDDELLDFAEKCENENLQLAVISYVETMIELEGCEIDYEARKLKYERRQLEKEIYEAHQRRVETTKKYIQAIKEKHFPIDADRLVNNYFRLSNKDPEGSFKALTTNPATFAPIDFSKIHDRFFGMIKVKPQDGIRINQKIGEFLKKLKV